MDTENVVIDEEGLQRKHKQERKELQSKIQALKKSVSKGDKKKKKEITEEIEKLEREIDEKQKQELSQLNVNVSESNQCTESIEGVENGELSKAQETSKMDTENVVFDEEELQRKHKQERKDLQLRIQALKKSVPKGDKKKKKEITEEIEKLEREIDERQKQELRQLNVNMSENNQQSTDLIEGVENGEVVGDVEPAVSSRMSRAQKRRNKKENEAKEREKRISEQAEKNKEGPRVLEINAIKQSLRSVNLKLHNIPADGNCLYLAVNHQLQVTGRPPRTVNELRKLTADFMHTNKDDFLPFMYNELDESEIISEEQFENYCKDVATTKLWGGQLELRALSNVLTCPIKIIQASGPPTVQGEMFNGPELTLTYHRHLYRLGEHYNSTLPMTGDDEDV